MPEDLPTALAELRTLLLDRDQLVRAVAAGRRRGSTPTWRRVELRPVAVKSGPVLQVTVYDATQAHTDNHDWTQAAATVDRLLAEPFGNWHVETRDATVQLRVTKKGRAQVHRAGAPARTAATGRHDRSKQRLVEPTEPFLAELGITTASGAVKASRADKYRQVEEFVRALDPVVRSAVDDGRLAPGRRHVVDLGCGNAYLTFAAYRHLSHRLGLDVDLTGVDVKAQARRHNEGVAARLGWADRVRFVEGTIGGADVAGADIVMALHACDTATDDALARAVAWRAPIVLAAPCCQHDLQLRLRQAGRTPDAVAGLLRQGILRERLGDLLTDAFRAEILRSHGYRVEVLEFVDTRHTPRNVLLRAELTAASAPGRSERLAAMTKAWGVTPRLAELLADESEGN
ncbi:MAG: SAM-dependent methyltransferase [Actinomycetota bacterium]|nr:SAM-dependent methyltransferase [Actinomycetota bacterium]